MYKKIEANWYDVWAAGVAVNELCVKKNLIGVVGPIGESVEIRFLDGKVGEHDDSDMICLSVGSGNDGNGGLSFSLNRVGT